MQNQFIEVIYLEYTVIILAAGKGERTGLKYNKVLTDINGKKVLDYSVDFFIKHKQCKEIVLVCSETDFNFIYDRYNKRVDTIIIGGETRQESVFKGLNKAVLNYVLIHDSARPYINLQSVNELITNLEETNATTLAVYVKDSIRESNGNRLGKTFDRNKLLAIQTPQGFNKDLLIEAHTKARKLGYFATDDTDLIAKFTEVTPAFVIGDYRSIKLTTKEDIELLKVIL